MHCYLTGSVFQPRGSHHAFLHQVCRRRVFVRAVRRQRPRCRHHRCWRDLSCADLREVGRCLPEGHRQPRELPVDRLGWRHPPDRRQDGGLRRFRHAADPREARRRRSAAVSHGDRRGRSGRQPRRHQARRHEAHRRGARRDLPRQDHQVERSGDRRAEPRSQALRPGYRRRPPCRRFGHHLRVHQLPLEGLHRVEREDR